MEEFVELRIRAIAGIHWMLVCGGRRTKGGIVHAKSGIERTKSLRRWGVMVGTASVACYH